MPYFKSVSVTTHAVERWRERAAIYANESMWDVLRAFEKTVKVKDNEPIPVYRKKDSVYFYNQEFDIYFVLAVNDDRTATITTVVRFSDFCDQQPMIETEKIEIPPVPIVEKTELEKLMELKEQQASLKDDFNDLQKQLNDNPSKRERHTLCTRLKITQGRLAKIKEELRRYSSGMRSNAAKLKMHNERIALIPIEVIEQVKSLRAERNRLLEQLRDAHAFNEVEAIARIKGELAGVKQQLKELTRKEKVT